MMKNNQKAQDKKLNRYFQTGLLVNLLTAGTRQ